MCMCVCVCVCVCVLLCVGNTLIAFCLQKQITMQLGRNVYTSRNRSAQVAESATITCIRQHSNAVYVGMVVVVCIT